MKRAIAAVAFTALLVFGGAGTAGASTAATYYTVGPFNFGPNASTTWNCQGVHVADGNGVAWELQTCQITGDTEGIVPGTYRSDPSLGLGTPTSGCPGAALGIVPGFFGGGPTCWSSDFNGQFASQWSQTFIPSGGGTYTFILVAKYSG